MFSRPSAPIPRGYSRKRGPIRSFRRPADRAFRYGARPPHEAAPQPGAQSTRIRHAAGADEPKHPARSSLTDEPAGVDLMWMGPTELPAAKVRELHIALRLRPPRKDSGPSNRSPPPPARGEEVGSRGQTHGSIPPLLASFSP